MGKHNTNVKLQVYDVIIHLYLDTHDSLTNVPLN